MKEQSWPRRARFDQLTPAETVIYDAVQAVEMAGADVRLTDAVVLLQAARESVADFVDGVNKRRYVTQHPEVCICAAIQLSSGRLIIGHRHNSAMRTALDMHVLTADIRQAEQGFVTSTGRFVGRKEAMTLQQLAGLPSKRHADGHYQGFDLTSEDLY